MTNYEHQEERIKEIILSGDDIACRNGIVVGCGDMSYCNSCDFDFGVEKCRSNRRNWLNAECKEPITLTEREHAFCVAVGTGWIARDYSDRIYLYKDKPTKISDEWCRAKYILSIYKYPFLPQFNFIQWSDIEPYSIEELLKLPVKEGE